MLRSEKLHRTCKKTTQGNMLIWKQRLHLDRYQVQVFTYRYLRQVFIWHQKPHNQVLHYEDCQRIVRCSPGSSLRGWREWVRARNFFRRNRERNSTRLLPILLATWVAFCIRVRDRSSRGYPLPPATQAIQAQGLHVCNEHCPLGVPMDYGMG